MASNPDENPSLELKRLGSWRFTENPLSIQNAQGWEVVHLMGTRGKDIFRRKKQKAFHFLESLKTDLVIDLWVGLKKDKCIIGGGENGH